MRRIALFTCFLPLLAAACGGGSETTGSGGSGGSGSPSSTTGTGGTGGGTDGTHITTDKGPVQGAITGETRIFLGIPYAAPPVGDLRWKPPQAHAAWTDELDASKLGPACAQVSALSPSFDPSSSEDCLTLNVWAPKAAKNAPVMVWIHGGSFVFGSGGQPDYDGQKLSEATGSVVVTINYRLGPLGFLSHSALRAEDSAHPSAGMYGFEDQRFALAWVKSNIAAFGGDPKNVTLFGESAGGISTCLHLLSPASEGLFHRAIIESGACAFGSSRTEIEAEAQGDAFTKALGCDGKSPADTLTCLRGKTAEEAVLALPTSAVGLDSTSASWFPVVDVLNIPDHPIPLLDAGQFAKVPTLLGSNKDEGTIFFALGNAVVDEAAYLAIAESLSPGNGDAIVAHYPSATYGSPKAAAIVALGDGFFVCNARRTARALANAGVPTYLYHFTHAGDALLPNLGAFHSGEIPFVFGNHTQLLSMSPTTAEKPLLDAMQGYWGRMAKGADPNGDSAFPWPKYDAATDENIVLDLTTSNQAGLKKDDCDFWDSL